MKLALPSEGGCQCGEIRYRITGEPVWLTLVINDEAHRSIYGDAREVVQFFQATRVGLTATPKAYLKNVDVEEREAENITSSSIP
jgi:type I restriction enzyme R subunit